MVTICLLPSELKRVVTLLDFFFGVFCDFFLSGLPPELEGNEKLRNIEPRMVEMILNEVREMIYMYVCMYVCMYVRMYVCLFICLLSWCYLRSWITLLLYNGTILLG